LDCKQVVLLDFTPTPKLIWFKLKVELSLLSQSVVTHQSSNVNQLVMSIQMNIQGKKYEGEIVDYTFMVNGLPVIGLYKQGRTGKKIYELPVRYTQRSTGEYYVPSYYVANNGQRKDPNMYFLGLKK
jgi:hypothetical protein